MLMHLVGVRTYARVKDLAADPNCFAILGSSSSASSSEGARPLRGSSTIAQLLWRWAAAHYSCLEQLCQASNEMSGLCWSVTTVVSPTTVKELDDRWHNLMICARAHMRYTQWCEGHG